VNTLAISLCIICQLFQVTGQLFLKKAMAPPGTGPGSGRVFAIRFVPGIVCLSLWFFIWLGVLQQQDLSHVYVFEGLNPALLAIAAWFLLAEHMNAKTWIGIAFICAGIAVVSAGQ